MTSKTMGYETLVRWFRDLYKDASEVRPPSWLQKSHWKPEICIRLLKDRRLIAVDVVMSGEIPRAIYHKEVIKLCEEHPNLRVIICVSKEGYSRHDTLKSFAKENGFGLKVLVPPVGLQTIVTTDIDAIPVITKTRKPIEWFPEPLLQAVTGLLNLSYSNILDNFVSQARGQTDATKIFKLICNTLDKLFISYPQCHTNIAMFMKLEHFEKLLKLADPNASDHVIHSFKVFLSGCPVINKFYKDFKTPHDRISISKNISIEYCWLLTSIFHDIGYPKQKGKKLLESELDDEDIDIIVKTKESKWNREEYKTAKKLLGSLGAFIAFEKDNKANWDGSGITDDQSRFLEGAWADIYNKLSHHSVISAFDLLADIVKQASAADMRKNRSFVVTHAVPAALAILLHDHYIWDDAKKWGLFPINASRIPMAALLIFADNWDDLRRKDKPPVMKLEDYKINEHGVKVSLKWLDNDAYKKELIKYNSFKKAIKNKPFKMEILAKVE